MRQLPDRQRAEHIKYYIQYVRKNHKKIRLREFKSNYFSCVYFQGFYSRMVEIMTGSSRVKVEPPAPENTDKEMGCCKWKIQW